MYDIGDCINARGKDRSIGVRFNICLDPRPIGGISNSACEGKLAAH
jgi:hypothetical protein